MGLQVSLMSGLTANLAFEAHGVGRRGCNDCFGRVSVNMKKISKGNMFDWDDCESIGRLKTKCSFAYKSCLHTPV